MLNIFSRLPALSLMALVLLGGGCLERIIVKGLNTELGGGDADEFVDGIITSAGLDAKIPGTVSTTKIPADFPADIPIMDNAIVANVGVKESDAWIAYSTTYSGDKVVTWYEEKLVAAHWEKVAVYNVEGTSTSSYRKDGYVLSVQGRPTDTGAEVTVSRSAE